MSADLLRRAAKVLREAAEGATPGPWEHVDYQGGPHLEVTYMGCGSIITMGEGVVGGNIAAPDGDLYPRSGYSPFEDMRYIALMHPPVALALADVLDFHAAALNGMEAISVADTLARAILREVS